MFHTSIWFWLLILAIFFISLFIVIHEIHRRDLSYVVPWWVWTFGGMGVLLLIISILTYTIMTPAVPHPLESMWEQAEQMRMERAHFEHEQMRTEQEQEEQEPMMEYVRMTPCSYHPRSSLPNTLLVDF